MSKRPKRFIVVMPVRSARTALGVAGGMRGDGHRSQAVLIKGRPAVLVACNPSRSES